MARLSHRITAAISGTATATTSQRAISLATMVVSPSSAATALNTRAGRRYAQRSPLCVAANLG
jgi:hypothetical protein